MNRKIKLIWDFRGPAATQTALHHEIHLKEYIVAEKLGLQLTGCQHINELYSLDEECTDLASLNNKYKFNTMKL